jgi:hypothetical protein
MPIARKYSDEIAVSNVNTLGAPPGWLSATASVAE